jgi:septal ring factor EnvC (AmiA/AmiB activator)
VIRDTSVEKLPVCPVCGNQISGSRTVSLFIAPSSAIKKGDLTPSAFERKKQTALVCGRCGTRFPVSVNRRRYAVVPITQLKNIQTRLARFKNEQIKLNRKIASLDEDKKKMKMHLKSSKEEADIEQLESKLNLLETHVSHLKKDKGALEQRITDLSAQQ